MKIIIVGETELGKCVAQSLADETNEITLLSSADPVLLEQAGIKESDLSLALTDSDETNLVVSSLAGLHRAKRRMTLLRNPAMIKTLQEFGFKKFHVDDAISPDLLAVQEIIKIIQSPGAKDVVDLVEGRISLRGFDIPKDSSLCSQKISDLHDDNFPWPFLIISIIRKDAVIIPKGETKLEAGDLIYVLLQSNSLAEFLTFVNPRIKPPKKVIIYGATTIGKNVAIQLSKKIKDITILEDNEDLAKAAADELGFANVIQGSARSDALKKIGIEKADIYIAASNNSHANLISAVLAKKKGAKRTIIVTKALDCQSIVSSMSVDAVVSPDRLAVDQIIYLVRGRSIRAAAKLMEGDAEVLEFIPGEGSAVTQDLLKNIKFPKNAIVGAVYSGNDVILPTGDTRIREGEKVVVFCHESAVKKLQELFEGRKTQLFAGNN